MAKNNCLLVICGEEPDILYVLYNYKGKLCASWSVKDGMCQLFIYKMQSEQQFVFPQTSRFVLLKVVTQKFGRLKSVRSSVLTLDINMNRIVLLLNPRNVLSVLFASRFQAISNVR